MKKFVFGLIAVGGSTLFTLLLLEIALWFFPVQSYIPIEPVTIQDPIVHYKPNVDQVYSAGWNFGAVNEGRTNAQGYIANYDWLPPEKKPLIAVVGDSYIEARMVPFDDTVQQRLRRLVDYKYRVYGVGIGGAPLSQYLAFAAMMRDKYKPGFLIVNIVENDFDESLPQYKNLPRFHYFFPMKDGRLRPLMIDQYIPSVFKELVSHSALVRYAYFHLRLSDTVNKFMFSARDKEKSTAPSDSGREQLTPALQCVMDSMWAIESFLNLLPDYSGLQRNQILLVVDGMRNNLYDGTQDSKEAKESYYGLMREHLIASAKDKKYEIIDLQPAMIEDYAKNGKRFEFPEDYHWNSYGHGIAAQEIMKSRNLKAFMHRNR